MTVTSRGDLQRAMADVVNSAASGPRLSSVGALPPIRLTLVPCAEVRWTILLSVLYVLSVLGQGNDQETHPPACQFSVPRRPSRGATGYLAI